MHREPRERSGHAARCPCQCKRFVWTNLPRKKNRLCFAGLSGSRCLEARLGSTCLDFLPSLAPLAQLAHGSVSHH